MKLTGTIDINHIGESIEISAEDNDSAIRFITISMTPLDFMGALFGHGSMKCIIELRGLDRLGTKREWKNAEITFHKNATKEQREAAARALEVDGWQARLHDTENHHFMVNYDGKTGIYTWRIHCERWVKIEGATDA